VAAASRNPLGAPETIAFMTDDIPHGRNRGSLAYEMRRHAAAHAIAICARLDRAAELCGIGAKTLYRYWLEPSFRVEVELQRKEIQANAFAATMSKHLAALDAAEKDLADSDPQVRQSAYNAIFQTTLGMVDRQTLMNQAEAIQQELNRREAPPQ
jgi:hypothetical protein